MLAASLAALMAASLAAVPIRPARAAPGAGPSDCATGPARDEVVAGIGPRGEIRLVSGLRAVLDSLRWPDAPPSDALPIPSQARAAPRRSAGRCRD
ncbi:hypothetical protein OMR07_29630 [Methylobacterium organophilum]|nr:hypothetical protein [Methylobacterium organophilum]